MKSPLQPLQLLLLILSGWINRNQQRVVEYLLEENSVLRELHKGKRLRFTDSQRRRLARKGKRLGRKQLLRYATIITPDTIMRWHRRLIAQKWTFQHKKPGRPPVMKRITELTVRMAKENPSWGYDRIKGALKNLGHTVSPTTIANILKKHGLDPAPERKRRTTWRTFLKAHWETFAAADFFTTEVWTLGGLVTFYVFFVMELSSRRIHIAGITPSPNEAFMTQVARNVTADSDGFLQEKRFLIIDRYAIQICTGGVRINPAGEPKQPSSSFNSIRSILFQWLLSNLSLSSVAALRSFEFFSLRAFREYGPRVC